MKTYITGLEVYDEADDLVCALTAFEDTFEVKWRYNIPMAEHLRYVADLLDKKELSEPLKERE